MEIIKYRPAFSPTKKLKYFIAFYTIVMVVSYYSTGYRVLQYMIPITAGVLILSLIIERVDSIYDGWRISEGEIVLERIDLISGKKSLKLSFSDIVSIQYVKRESNVPLTFLFLTKEKKYKLQPIRLDIFQFAGTLKYLKNQNIAVEFSRRDHEVELYLQGKIPSIPMTNDMEVKN